MGLKEESRVCGGTTGLGFLMAHPFSVLSGRVGTASSPGGARMTQWVTIQDPEILSVHIVCFFITSFLKLQCPHL